MDSLHSNEIFPFINPGLTMDWLKKNSTGKKVKVAVLDSGIDAWHSELKDKVIRTCVVRKNINGNIECNEIRKEQSVDSFGHGTAVAGCITSIAPDVELINIKILNDYNSCTPDILNAGLKWALEENIKLINISAISTKQSLGDLFKLTEQAYIKNSIIVASSSNRGNKGYPASFSSVVSVDNQSYSSKYHIRYRENDLIEYDAQGNYLKVLAPDDSYAIKSGTSFATPHVTGIIALLIQLYPKLTAPEAKAILCSLSKGAGNK